MSDDQRHNPSSQGPPSHSTGASQEAWILQQLNNVSRETGILSASVTALAEQTKDLNARVDGIHKSIVRIQITMGVATGALFVIGYLIDKRFDQLLGLLPK